MVYFNEKLEPEHGFLIHGAGQDMNTGRADDFRDYWKTVREYKPLLYVAYLEIRHCTNSWFNKLMTRVSKFPNTILQLGISMTDEYDKTKDSNYEKRVLEGEYDDKIRSLMKNLKSLNQPVFLRLGYEFNGADWNGYEPDTYVQAYKYVVDEFEENEVNNVIWVWNARTTGDEEYEEYYPRDDYVNWWSLNTFSKNDTSSEFTRSFLESAEEHEKPVMIGESCPAHSGVNSEDAWTEWFQPYFNFIKNNPIIKSFCYVNLNWKKYERFKHWKNCRITINQVVKEKYLGELESLNLLSSI